MNRPNWDQWYLSLAAFVAKRSRDPSTKVGSVIVRPDNTQVSFGYNDFPRGVEHHAERYEDRHWKYPAIVHAETNAILNAREAMAGCTLYSTFHPCARCAAQIVQAGIRCVVVPDDPVPERLAEDMTIASTIFCEAGVSVRRIRMPHAMNFGFLDFVRRKKRHSLEAFGPRQTAAGVIDHIKKEVKEIEEAPNDLEEWIDLILLALDGAWRAGYPEEDIVMALAVKQAKNEARRWPDWRMADPNKAFEHVREEANG